MFFKIFFVSSKKETNVQTCKGLRHILRDLTRTAYHVAERKEGGEGLRHILRGLTRTAYHVAERKEGGEGSCYNYSFYLI